MSASGPLTEWYVARDGQQYGPLTDLEMRKFVELGHLRPTDLVWRQGFADWRPAPAVFPQRPLQTPLPRRAAQPAELAHRPASRSHETDGELRMGGDFHGHSAAARRQTAVATSAVSEPEAAELEDEPEAVEARPRRWGRRFLLLLALMAILGGAGWYAMNNPDLVSRVHVLMEARPEPAAETLRVAPFKPVGAAAAQVDEAFQRTALWQVIKREFPDWYADRVKEAVQLNGGDKRDEAAISRHFAEAVVGLRRQHAEQALAASPAALRTVAANFLASLKHLS